MKVGIIGIGMVGNALREALKDAHDLELYDKYKKEYQDNPVERLSLCEAIFICVNTPMRISGEIDLSAINDSMELILKTADKDNPKVIIIKSSAVSGTTEDLAKKYDMPGIFDFVFNPEFLTARNAVDDFKNTDRIVLGTNSVAAFEIVKRIYLVAGFWCPIIKTDFKTAGMAKYISNAFLAAKTSLANEFYNICQKTDVHYEEVIKLLLLDKRIGKSHWSVPGPDKDFGFGGFCFPKDINALIYLAKEKGYHPYLLEEAWRSNLTFRKNKDWEK